MSVEPVAVDDHVGDEGWICGRLVATRRARGRWPRRRGVARIRPSGWVLKALCSIRGESATVCLARDATRGSFVGFGGARCALMVARKRQTRRRESRRRWHHSVGGSGIGLAHRSAERLSTRLWRPPSRARRLARKLPPNMQQQHKAPRGCNPGTTCSPQSQGRPRCPGLSTQVQNCTVLY